MTVLCAVLVDVTLVALPGVRALVPQVSSLWLPLVPGVAVRRRFLPLKKRTLVPEQSPNSALLA